MVGVLLVFVVLGPFGRTALAHGNEIWKECSYLGGMDAIALGCLTAIVLTRMQLPPLRAPDARTPPPVLRSGRNDHAGSDCEDRHIEAAAAKVPGISPEGEAQNEDQQCRPEVRGLCAVQALRGGWEASPGCAQDRAKNRSARFACERPRVLVFRRPTMSVSRWGGTSRHAKKLSIG
jgi:hypothetical protein